MYTKCQQVDKKCVLDESGNKSNLDLPTHILVMLQPGIPKPINDKIII
jgi:hypothetical protein